MLCSDPYPLRSFRVVGCFSKGFRLRLIAVANKQYVTHRYLPARTILFSLYNFPFFMRTLCKI